MRSSVDVAFDAPEASFEAMITARGAVITTEAPRLPSHQQQQQQQHLQQQQQAHQQPHLVDPLVAFPNLWSNDLAGEGELEMEAMTEYLANGFSSELPLLDDMQFGLMPTSVPVAAPPPLPLLLHADPIKLECEDYSRPVSGAQASTWTKEREEDDDDDDCAFGFSADEADEGPGGGATSSKRRRRIRNLKQQELNRLAQQRYRQRKKKKHSDLQTALDSLTEKLAALDAMGKEATVLRATVQTLRQQLARSEAQLAAAEAMVQRQGQALTSQQARLGAQERLLSEQAASAAALATSGVRINEPAALCEQVLCMVRAALLEVSSQPGGAGQAQVSDAAVQDAVVQHLSRSLSRCCLAYSQATARSAGEAPPAHLPVSACC